MAEIQNIYVPRMKALFLKANEIALFFLIPIHNEHSAYAYKQSFPLQVLHFLPTKQSLFLTTEVEQWNSKLCEAVINTSHHISVCGNLKELKTVTSLKVLFLFVVTL